MINVKFQRRVALALRPGSCLYGAPVGPLDAFWHLVNFVAPALGLAALATLLSKLLWRKALAARPLRLLWLVSAAAGIGALLLGWLLFGRDGRMATYALLVLCCALALWWQGFVAKPR